MLSPQDEQLTVLGVLPDTEAQQTLDRLDYATAWRHRHQLRDLIARRPALCYTGINPQSAVARIENTQDLEAMDPVTPDDTPTYTSSTFRAIVDLLVITASDASLDLGFIQYCTGKKCRADYEDGTAWELRPGAPFPICDSAHVTDFPFYYKGENPFGNAAGRPCYRKVKGESIGEISLEVTDLFVHNGFPGNERAHPTQFVREQSFTCWLARQHSLQERLLWELHYDLSVRIVCDRGEYRLDEDSSSIRDAKFHPQTVRPRPNAMVMNGRESWYRLPSDGHSPSMSLWSSNSRHR